MTAVRWDPVVAARRHYGALLGPLVGATVAEVFVDAAGAPCLALRRADGSRVVLTAMADPEGNGPGALWVTPLPGGRR